VLCLTAPEARATARDASAAATAQAAAPRYARHVPARTLLYALVQAHYPDFLARLEAKGRSLPAYVREELDAYLQRYGDIQNSRKALHPMSEISYRHHVALTSLYRHDHRPQSTCRS
jgi:hypothetical protein